jgi:hypothetical protein
MGYDLPPTRECDRLRKELRLVPAELKADAVQEAWLAHLQGECPVQAVKTYAQRERRRQQKERAAAKVEVAALCLA